MVECDVKLTSDWRCILFHDETLDRTTDGYGPVAERTLEDVSAFDAGVTFDRAFIGEAVPTLEEAIDLWDALGQSVNIEIKPCPGREKQTGQIVAETLLDCWPEEKEKPLLSSFSNQALEETRRLLSDWPLGLLYQRLPKDWEAEVEALKAVSVHVNAAFLTKAQVGKLKAKNLAVLAYTVNKSERAKELWDWGVDAVFSDRPDLDQADADKSD